MFRKISSLVAVIISHDIRRRARRRGPSLRSGEDETTVLAHVFQVSSVREYITEGPKPSSRCLLYTRAPRNRSNRNSSIGSYFMRFTPRRNSIYQCLGEPLSPQVSSNSSPSFFSFVSLFQGVIETRTITQLWLVEYLHCYSLAWHS